jgi:hypothetical protein
LPDPAAVPGPIDEQDDYQDQSKRPP